MRARSEIIPAPFRCDVGCDHPALADSARHPGSDPSDNEQYSGKREHDADCDTDNHIDHELRRLGETVEVTSPFGNWPVTSVLKHTLRTQYRSRGRLSLPVIGGKTVKGSPVKRLPGPLYDFAHPEQRNRRPASIVGDALERLITAGAIERFARQRRHQLGSPEALGAGSGFAEFDDQPTDAAPNEIGMRVHRPDARRIDGRVQHGRVPPGRCVAAVERCPAAPSADRAACSKPVAHNTSACALLVSPARNLGVVVTIVEK
jgi:hypothetical protein